MINFLYNTYFGRICLKILCKPAISRACGKIMDSRISLLLIPSFVKKNKINMDEYISEDYKCFNNFFFRKIKPELRTFDASDDVLCAPCDGLLSIYRINNLTVLPIKQSDYSIEDLLNNRELAEEFRGGYCFVYRLCVNHYHRYSYFDSGHKGKNIFIPGILHTVRPVALRRYPVFVRNSREYSVLETDHFGKAVQIEVGALMVGKIVNEHEEYDFIKGEEKGHFEYGGSTIIVLLKAGRVDLDNPKLVDTGIEIPVKIPITVYFIHN